MSELEARDRFARRDFDQRHHDDRNRSARDDSARHRRARRTARARRLDRRSDRRALRRLGVGGTLVAVSRIRRNVRLPAQRLRRRSVSARRSPFSSTGSSCCTRRACWPAATSVLRTTPPISIRRSGRTSSRTMPLAVGIGVVTIVLLYRRTSQVACSGAVLAVAATLTVALVAFAGLSHANFTQAFHLTAAAPLQASGSSPGSAARSTSRSTTTSAMPTRRCSATRSSARSARFPLAIVLSVLIVAMLYVLLQVGVLGAVPWQSLLDAHGQPTAQAQYVGAFVVERTWGRVAAVAVTLLVLVTAFASLYGNLLGFSRISFAAARDGAFLPGFGKLHPRKEIPHVALLAVGVLSLVASLFTLDQVIAFLTAGHRADSGHRADRRARRYCARVATRAPFRMPLYPLPGARRARRLDARLRLLRAPSRLRSASAGSSPAPSSFSSPRARSAGGRFSLAPSDRVALPPACPRADAPARGLVDLEHVARHVGTRLSGLHRRRPAVLRLRRGLLLRAHSARALARCAAGLQAASASTRSTST